MNNNVKIRWLADCQHHINDLALIHFEGISKHWVPEASPEKSCQSLIKHATHHMPFTLVAEIHGKAIGMASLRVNDGLSTEQTPWLGSLVVDPTYQGQGMGEQLIEAIKKEAQTLNYDKLYLLAFDPTIPSWYLRLGWEKIGMDKLFGHPVTIMQINLSDPVRT
jgi:N-acetylglutamate synthase-like GNAT family acetyltransferase